MNVSRAERIKEYTELLPTLQRVEHTLVGTQIKRDIRIYKDFCTGLYTYEALGERYNGLRGARISQIVRSVAHQTTTPNEPNPLYSDQTLMRRNNKIFDLYCTGLYSYDDLSNKFNLGAGRVKQIIREVTFKIELRRAKEAINEQLIDVVLR